MTSKKYKEVCKTWNCIEQFLILASTITGCVSIPAFASLIGIPIGITISAMKYCKIALLAKSKLNSWEVLKGFNDLSY